MSTALATPTALTSSLATHPAHAAFTFLSGCSVGARPLHRLRLPGTLISPPPRRPPERSGLSPQVTCAEGHSPGTELWPVVSAAFPFCCRCREWSPF